MNAKLTRHLVILAAALVLAAPATAQWVDGQNAQYVVGQPDFTSAGNSTSQNELSNPGGVAVDTVNGKLYVADRTNSRILRYAHPLTGNQPNAEAVLGQADYTSGTPNRSGSVAANTLNHPRHIAVDSASRLWVVDSDNNRVLRFDNAHVKANGADADGVLGQADFTSSGMATTQAGMNTPLGLVVTATGVLYVADSTNNRVLRFDVAAAKANGANADGVLGQTNFTTGGAFTTQAGMYAPSGVAVDGANLFVADSTNNRVLRFDNAAAKADGANADGVLGQANFTSGTGATTQAGMSGPRAVAVDASGRLYVAESGNRRVTIYGNAAAKANGANADNVLGQADFTSNGAATTQAGMQAPYGVAVDSVNDVLLVADWAINRAVQFSAGGALPVEMSAFSVE